MSCDTGVRNGGKIIDKHGSSDPGKTSQTRALLFDISFLMLCHVTQVYGMEVRFEIIDKHGSSDPGKTS